MTLELIAVSNLPGIFGLTNLPSCLPVYQTETGSLILSNVWAGNNVLQLREHSSRPEPVAAKTWGHGTNMDDAALLQQPA